MSSTDPDKKSARDVRVDHIGFVDELKKHFGDDLRSKVKLSMAEKDLLAVEGDFFEGKLVVGSVSTIDAGKFYRRVKKLIEAGEMTESQFVSCISVIRGEAKAFFPERDLDAMSDAAPATPQLRIARKKGAELTLQDAVKGAAAAIGE